MLELRHYGLSLLFVALFAIPQGILPRVGKGEADITTHGLQVIPKSGTATVQLEDKDHPSRYLRRPGCWAKELGKKQHIFRIKNDLMELTIYDAHPGSVIEWECHGAMQKNAYELCMSKAITPSAAIACGPGPSVTQ